MSGVNAHDGDVWGAHSRRGGELSSPGSGARPRAARARRRPGPPPTHGDDPAPRQRPASCQASRGWTLQAGLEPASAAGRAWSGPVWAGRGPRSSRGRGWMESHEAVRSGEGRKGAAVSGPRRQGAQALVQTGRRQGGDEVPGEAAAPRAAPRAGQSVRATRRCPRSRGLPQRRLQTASASRSLQSRPGPHAGRERK